MDLSTLVKFVIDLFEKNLPLGIAMLALIIIGALLWGFFKMKKSMSGDTKMADSVKSVSAQVDKVCKEISEYSVSTKEDHEKLIEKMENDSRELREAISTLKDVMSALQNDMVRTRERITDSSASTSSSIKLMISQMERLVDKVVDISSTLKTIVADVFRERIGQKIDQKDNNKGN